MLRVSQLHGFNHLKRGGDPYWGNVVLLMHMDTSGFIDEKGHTVTPSGDAQIATSMTDFGNAYYSPSGGYGSTNYLAVTVDSVLQIASKMTYEFFFYLTNIADARQIFQLNDYFYAASGGVTLTHFNGNIKLDVIGFSTGDVSVNINTWYYCKITIDGYDCKLYLGNTLVETITIDPDLPPFYGVFPTIENLTIGAGIGNGQTLTPMSGMIDEIRITQGVVRVSVQPTAPFPNS